MSITYNINDIHCPRGHVWTFIPDSTLFQDCYYCRVCDKIYAPTVKEITKEWFDANYNTDRMQDLKKLAAIIDAKAKVKTSDLIKLGYLK